MKHLLLLAITLTVSTLQMHAQLPFERIKREQPDMLKIKRETQDSHSKYYYPTLLKEYLANDTVMKLDKFRALYLGTVFQEDYDPYRKSPAPAMKDGPYKNPNPTSTECEQIISNARTALASNPFDMYQISAMVTAMNLLGQTNLAKIWQYKLNYLLMTIVSTGTGDDEKNAWYVIEPQHEYVLLNHMGYIVTNHLFYDPHYEYLTVINPEGDREGAFYFNLEYLLAEHYRKFPDEQ